MAIGRVHLFKVVYSVSSSPHPAPCAPALADELLAANPALGCRRNAQQQRYPNRHLYHPSIVDA